MLLIMLLFLVHCPIEVSGESFGFADQKRLSSLTGRGFSRGETNTSWLVFPS